MIKITQAINRFIAVGILICFSFNATAGPPKSEQADRIVGSVLDYNLSPDLSAASKSDQGRVWTRQIHQSGASFIKVHFKQFNLRAGDALDIVNAKGRLVETLTGMGPKSRINFWSLSAQGNLLELRFRFASDYKRAPFEIDSIAVGNGKVFPQLKADRSYCSSADFVDSACFQDDADKWDSIQASVALLGTINDTDVFFCSDSNISPNNIVMTNYHCLNTQLNCDDTEFVFNYRRSACDSESPVEEWTSYRCDEFLESSGVNPSCVRSPTELDMSVSSVMGDPAADFGYIDIDTVPLTSGEDIYIVQHPLAGPQQVATGRGSDVVVDGHTLRMFNTLDTIGGSSGSPVLRTSNNKVVGLFGCGGPCWTSGNTAALMTDIAPVIEPYLCSETLLLQYAQTEGFSEVSGNGNGSIDPGESWSFQATAQNSSCSADSVAVGGVAVVNASITENISIDNGNLAFGDIPAGSSGSSSPVVFNVPVDATCGAAIAFDLTSLNSMSGGGYEDQSNALSASIGELPAQFLLSEHFETGFGNWTFVDGGTGNGPNSTWALPTGLRQSTLTLTQPYLVADSDLQGAGSVMDEELISNPLDVDALEHVVLQFTHDFHFNGDNATREYGDVDVKSSATSNQWVTVKRYTDVTTTGTVTVDVTPYKANDLQVRFHYYDADGDYYWAVDDIFLIGDDGFVCDVFDTDDDGDGVTNSLDNCSMHANSSQFDANGDGYGNRCDPDLDDNGIVNFGDYIIFIDLFLSTDPIADFDEDGSVNFGDFGIFANFFLMPPGPSGLLP